MPKRLIGGILAVLALWPAAAGAAGPSTLYSQVLRAYQTGGNVPPCRFSGQQLASVRDQVDTYGQQYYADFIAAIQTAIASRASGACSRSHGSAMPTSGGRLPAGPALPASVTASTSSGVPAAMIALGIVAALLAGAAGLWAVLRRRGAPAEWSHGWAEARYRAGDLWGLARRRR
jgi:hypothetical protein